MNGIDEIPVLPVNRKTADALFCDTVSGAEASAAVYSIVETAHANGELAVKLPQKPRKRDIIKRCVTDRFSMRTREVLP